MKHRLENTPEYRGLVLLIAAGERSLRIKRANEQVERRKRYKEGSRKMRRHFIGFVAIISALVVLALFRSGAL